MYMYAELGGFATDREGDASRTLAVPPRSRVNADVRQTDRQTDVRIKFGIKPRERGRCEAVEPDLLPSYIAV